jgi:hypothetical protein
VVQFRFGRSDQFLYCPALGRVNLALQQVPEAFEIHFDGIVTETPTELGLGYSPGMSSLSSRGHRFPASIIQHAIWLYLRFSLSYRDVEELLAERGLDLSYETIRRWVLKFGPMQARRLRQRRPRPGDRWHLDEMVVRIAGPSTRRAKSSISWSSLAGISGPP